MTDQRERGLISGQCPYGGFGFLYSPGNGHYERVSKESGECLGLRISDRLHPRIRAFL